MKKLIFGIILCALALLLLLFTVQNFFNSQAELEPKAANMFLLVAGLPGLLFGAGGIALIVSYTKRSNANLGSAPPKEQKQSDKYCANCGAQMQVNAAFCPKCGKRTTI